MKQIFTNAAEAMEVAFELSKLLRRPELQSGLSR